MPVRSDGAASSSDSLALAYSNSKPTMSRPTPTATPFVGRFAGVVVVPMNAVASANAGAARRHSSEQQSTIQDANGAYRMIRSVGRSNSHGSAVERRTGRCCAAASASSPRQRSVRTSRSGTKRSTFRRSCSPKLAALGLMGIQFPEEYGGAAMSSVDYCICIEELARVDPSICLSVAAHNGLGAAHIAAFGTEEQKQQLSGAARAGRKAGRLGAHRGLVRQRRGGDADDGGARGRLLGHQRHEAIHHPRPLRRSHRRDGGDQPRARGAAASPPSSSSAARPGSAPARRKTSWGCAPAKRAK